MEESASLHTTELQANGIDRSTQSEIIRISFQAREANINKIEAVFQRIAEDLANEQGNISITLRQRADIDSAEEPKFRRVAFPGKSAEEAWCFGKVQARPLCIYGIDDEAAVIVRILELMHEALRKDVILSKRDIYYRDPALFGAQVSVDRYVDDIVCTFGVSRSSMNVSAAAKGLVAGAVKFCLRDGSLSTIKSDSEGILVPSLRDILPVDISMVKWILVVEKEATFRAIASSRFWKSRADHGIIITGKGYPDIATRALLRLLSTPAPQNGFACPPVFGLVDFDPDGLAILSTYHNGSKALAHESHDLRVPSLRWLGLQSQQLLIGNSGTHTSQGLLELSNRDRRKAQRLLERQVCLSNESGIVQWRGQLQHMLMLNVKAELQLLHSTCDDLTNLLKQELEGYGR